MYQSLIAVYPNLPDAAELRRELSDVGIKPDQVHISSETASTSGATTTGDGESRGFFDWLFGVPEEEISGYQRQIESGRTIVKVHASESQVEKASQILDRYDPIDVDTEAAGAAAGPATAAGAAAGGAARAGTEGEARIPVAEEEVRVGKRQVERGGVRVHSYVVEQPFEELVRLRNESVKVERRPASGATPAGDDAFRERSFTMREREEVPVVEKSARVKEDVVVSKDAGERTERVRDTVRRTQVDVEREPEAAGTAPRERK